MSVVVNPDDSIQLAQTEEQQEHNHEVVQIDSRPQIIVVDTSSLAHLQPNITLSKQVLTVSFLISILGFVQGIFSYLIKICVLFLVPNHIRACTTIMLYFININNIFMMIFVITNPQMSFITLSLYFHIFYNYVELSYWITIRRSYMLQLQ